MESALVSTGEAARLLGVSRQHVVDLCERGELPFVRVGKHRRVRRADIEAMIRPELTRDQLAALWVHRAVAGKVVADPEAALAKATENVTRLREAGATAVWLDRWEDLLGGGIEVVLDTLTSHAETAVELRRNSPFGTVLSDAERDAVLESFQRLEPPREGPPRGYAKPYVVAERLDLLRGPTTGVVVLPRHLDWSPDPRYELDAPGSLEQLHRTVLNEAATPDDLYTYLDEATLLDRWAHLWLPEKLRSAWEHRFPQLAELRRVARHG